MLTRFNYKKSFCSLADKKSMERYVKGYVARRFELGDILNDNVTSIITHTKIYEERSAYTTKLYEYESYLQPGNLVLVGGYPGIGKSNLIYDMVKELYCWRRKSVAIFSLASNEQQVILELLSRMVGCDICRLRNDLLYEDEWDRLVERLVSLLEGSSSHNLFIDTTPYMTIEYLERSLGSFYIEGCNCAFVDYIQLMEVYGNTPFQNNFEKMSHISHNLKQLAKSLNIPIVVVCQVHCMARDCKQPPYSLNDFCDCGTLVEDADVVMMVDRPEIYNVFQDKHGRDLHGVTIIPVLKDRNGNPFRQIELFWEPSRREYITLFDHIHGTGELLPSKINDITNIY